MNHIPADQLRNYQFGLLPEADATETAAHLETCTDCREKLHALETQFAALDVLRDQPAVSDEILAAVVGQRRRRFQLRLNGRRALFFPTEQDAPSTFWKPALAVAASLLVLFGILRMDRTAESRQDAGDTLAALRAEQPFPPASNIELNVLPRRDEVQLTIYNEEDLTLVREKRKLVLNRGWNWLQFMWSNTLIDPTSLELEPKTHAAQIEITQLVYPPRLNDLARWTIFSDTDCVAEFELTYFTSGLKWNAFYEATLAPDEQSMQLASYVRVDNHSGEDYEEAQTRLVVGNINMIESIATLSKRPHPYDQPMLERFNRLGERNENLSRLGFDDFEIEGAEAMLFGKVKEVIKQSLSEYQLYTIEGRETIPDGWGKRLPSFTAQEIGVTNLYKFEVERWGDQTMRFLSFANTRAHQLGETPLPNGRVRVFGNIVDGASSSVSMGGQRQSTQRELRNDQRPSLIQNGAGREAILEERKITSVYVGAADLKYIPVGETVELELGPARKVMVEPKLMRFRNENHQFDQKGNVSGWDEIGNWKIEITNTKDVPVEVEIMRATDSAAWKIKTDTPYEKYDMSHFRFMVKLDPQSKKTIEYELTVHHGTRKDAAVSTESVD